MSTDRDFRPGGRDSNPGLVRRFVPYINGWINETKKTLALEGGMDRIAKLMADLKKMAYGNLTEAAGPVPAVAQMMDVTLAKAPEQNYAFKGKKQYQPPGKPTKDSKTVEGPGAFEDLSKELEKGGDYPKCPKCGHHNAMMPPQKDGTRKCRDCGNVAKSKTEALKGSMNKLSKVLERLSKRGSVVTEEDAPEAPAPDAPVSDEPAPEPAAEPEAELEPEISLAAAIQDQLAHGVAQGVIGSLATVYGNVIDLNKPEVAQALDEIERQYTQKGNQFFAQFRSKMLESGPLEADELIRKAVRVFRELA